MQDDLVIEEIKANDKREVIRKFPRLLKATGRIEHEDELVGALLERESLGNTGLGGKGVALPHGKLHFSPKMIVVCGKASKGIDFQTRDEKPAKIYSAHHFHDRSGKHFRALARISRKLKNHVLRESLKDVQDRWVSG
jgi:mannitol/fructose-specific phosphotransferase system IIA component (Ntr-type)